MTGALLRRGGEGGLLWPGRPASQWPERSSCLPSSLALRTDLQLSLQKTALFPPVWLAEPTFAMLERYVFLLSLLTNTVTSVKNNTHAHY